MAKQFITEAARMQKLAGIITENIDQNKLKEYHKFLLDIGDYDLAGDFEEMASHANQYDSFEDFIKDEIEILDDPKITGLIKNKYSIITEVNINENKGLTGHVDFRYENTLRLSFDEPAYGDLDTDEGEYELDSINSKLYELLNDVSDGEMEIDWRDDSEVEIHNIDQDKFYEKYDDSFISLI
jgi:hypothetical protein